MKPATVLLHFNYEPFDEDARRPVPGAEGWSPSEIERAVERAVREITHGATLQLVDVETIDGTITNISVKVNGGRE